jgi:ATP/maltotriose-dependent transcriptional regulator MalT
VATKKISGEITPPEIVKGVTLSRTLPPLQPANFLARRHLVERIDVRAPGTTLIVGPIGYGKSSLASEIAQSNSDRTFWYTMVDEDTPSIFNAHVIQAVRNVLPGFAPWFEAEPNMNPMDLIIRFSNDLALLKSEYIFIVDNRRTSMAEDFAIADQMIRSLPRNLHLIQIRRASPDASADELAPTGNLQIIGPQDLRFNYDEIQAIATLNELSPLSAEFESILQSAQGWPAAVQLIARGLSKGESFTPSAKDISGAIEPLRLIVTEVVKSLTDQEKSLLLPLSAVHEFSAELAFALSRNSIRSSELDQLAAEGSLLIKTAGEDPRYQIHSLIREALYKEFSLNQDTCRETHAIASNFYEGDLNPTLALEHAFLAQDFVRFEKLFPDGARLYSVTGRGNQLLRWAKYAGDESVEGQLKRQTVEIAGHLANLDYAKVEAMLASMRLQSQGTALADFMKRYTALIEVAPDFAFARFESLKANVELAITSDEMAADNDFTDTLYALRRLAAYCFIVDDLDGLEEVEQKSRSLLEQRFTPLGHIHQLAISAMAAYLQGFYNNAQNISRMAMSLSQKMGLTSLHSPHDVHYVSARVLYELTEHEQALEQFKSLAESSLQSQQWVWCLLANSYIANDKAIKGQLDEALEELKQSQSLVTSIRFTNNLMAIVDRSELFVRLMMKDLGRMKILIETALEGRLVENARLHILDLEDKPWAQPETLKLPDRTPREKIYKLITEAILAGIESQEAKELVGQALKLGSEVGAKETFLREVVLFPIYIRISIETPTFYHEEIARGAMKRMQEINASGNIKPELTKREIEIVRHLDSGKPITSIGASLHISHNTMKTHLKNVYRKLGVDGRDQAVEKAKSLGLI